MSCWTPRELDLAGYILTASREAKMLDGVGDHDQAKEIHRELWDARHELRSIRESMERV